MKLLMKRNTLGRGEHLKSEKSITGLFETGKSLSLHPIRLIYQPVPPSNNFPVKVGFAVPRKNFKRAVDRNLLKRRMREAYRLKKNLLVLSDNPGLIQGIDIMLVYQGHTIEDYNKISESIAGLLKKLAAKISKNN